MAKYRLTPDRPGIRASRQRAYDLYFAGAKKAYDAAWQIVLRHLPPTAKLAPSPYLDGYFAALEGLQACRHTGLTFMPPAPNLSLIDRLSRVFSQKARAAQETARWRHLLEQASELVTKAGVGAGTLADPMILGDIRQTIIDTLGITAQEAAEAIAAGEARWFTAQGIPYSPATGAALYRQYVHEFDRKRGGFKTIATNATDAVLAKVHAYYAEPTNLSTLQESLALDFSPYNAERVARSEVTRLSSCMTESTMRDFGQSEWEWVANGPNPCEICQALDGQKFELDGGQEMPPEGSHPNDECTAVSTIDDAALDDVTPDAGEPEGETGELPEGL